MIDAETKMYSVSIIIPTYNRKSYVVETINSVLCQTYQSIEIIVVDDGSTDNTRDSLQEFIEDKKITYLWQKNAGRSSARNLGAKIANGSYLLFLDSDDILVETAIENLLLLTKDSRLSKIFGARVVFFSGDDNSNLLTGYDLNFAESFRDRKLIVEVIGDFFLSIGAFIIDRKSFEESGGFLTEFEPSEDVDFSIKVLLNNFCTWSKDFDVVKKRRHESNTSNTKLHEACVKICYHYIVKLKKEKLIANRKLRRLLLSNFYERLFAEQLHLNTTLQSVRSFLLMCWYHFPKMLSLKKYKLFIYLWFRKPEKNFKVLANNFL